MRLAHIALVLSLAALAHAQESAPYPVFETDKLPPSEYKARRAQIKSQIGPGGIGVFFTNSEKNRNNDVDFLFRGDSNFLYLTGFEEPNGVLLLIPGGATLGGQTVTEVLFVDVSTLQSLTWNGYRMGPDNARRLLGIEAAYPLSQFESVLGEITRFITNKKIFTTRLGPTGSAAAAFEKWRSTNAFETSTAPGGWLSRMREIKSPAEIALLRKVAHISAMAHVEAMRSLEPGMREWEISALVQYIFARGGCEYTGYPPIVGSGPNSTILHYEANRRQTVKGDIICMDTAGEFHGYSADVTRSFPVSGKFSPEQKAIYQVVFDAQEAAMKASKPGADLGAISGIASKELADGLIRLGIIKNAGELGRYYMHGLSHGIGLDVHDPMPRILAPGTVFTIEPGIYIKEGSPCDKKWWNIGVRIEDDILITSTGYENLSAAAPRTVAAIEKLMAEKGIGNIAQKPIGK